jgi:hypothetical protein
MVPLSSIIAAMSDVRPGRFYSVDELAVVLGVRNRAALQEQLRTMACDLDVHNPFKISQGSTDEFYRRAFSAPMAAPSGTPPN